MTNAILERAPVSFGFPGQTAAPNTTGAPTVGQYCVTPRCTLKFEKCEGGFKIHCKCDDQFGTATLQNLCRMLADGMCSCCCTWNGLAVCNFNLCCGNCTCEPTKDGVCITCRSGDKQCCAILQSCCDSLQACCNNGCTCYVSFNNTPCCCGTCA